MATQICVTLVEQASEDDKIAAAKSGILPALKAIIDDPPPPPAPAKGPAQDQKTAPEDVPLPESPATATGTELPDDSMPSRTCDDSVSDPSKGPITWENDQLTGACDHRQQ